MTDIQELDARALKTTKSLVDLVDPSMLGLPTPCGSWTLGQLLAHMTGQNHGFAAAAREEAPGLEVWADRPVGDDPAGAFAESAAEVTAAFAEEGVLERSFWLAEVRGGQFFPAPTAIGFHLLDYVVHGWDVAVSLGRPAEFDTDLLEAVLPIAGHVPTGPARERPGAAFAPVLDGPAGAGLFPRILRLLGRDPDWSGPRG
ncbi:TIGR03086 family metal-binding protein [Kitasatospora sp. NPDC088391]|uniref:TIGR03086 family metal-binding protein n=1 Tax=Kitasatospora sp. NPDC088391 TaxID=3364074 RepID=UPI00382752D4